MTSIQQTVRNYLANTLARPMEGITDGDSLLERGVVDSLAVMRLVAFIEEEYGVRIDDEDLMPEHFDTLDTIAAFIESRRAEAQ